MDTFINILGILGTFFAVLLVLAVSVETILDFFKLTGLLRGRISPEQATKDIADWVPQEPEQARAKVVALKNMLGEFKVKSEEVSKQAHALKTPVSDTSEIFGLSKPLSDAEQNLVVTLTAIRKAYENNEGRRVAALRVISAVIGIAITFMLQIDAIQLLSDTLPSKLHEFVTSQAYMSSWLHYGGFVLTGFAASAGSSFWHDQLDRVRALKESVRSAAETLEIKKWRNHGRKVVQYVN